MNARHFISGEDLLATLKLAIPLVIAELGWMLMGIVDTMFVGRLPNSADAIGIGSLEYAVEHLGTTMIVVMLGPMKAPPIGDRVHGAVDWARRFDHMQQHTGQHVLSAAFEAPLDGADPTEGGAKPPTGRGRGGQ